MKRTAWGLLAVGLALLSVSSGVLAQSLQPSATAEETDDGSASIRVLLQLHESAGHDARYRAHVDELVSSLKGQAVADDSDNADAAADAEEEAFGEAPAPAATEVIEAVAADGAESQEPWNAGAAFVEVDTNSDDAADADAKVDADAEEEVFGEAPERVSDAVVAEAEGDVEDDGAHWSAGAAFVEVDAGSDDEADAEAEAEEEVFGEAPDQASDAVTAEAEADVEDDGAHWSAGPAFVEVDADSDSDDAADADAEEEVFGEAPDQASDAVTAEAEGDVEDDGAHWNAGSAFVEVDADADEEDAEDEESDEEAETAFVQVGGDWKDPPVWWKAPEEEMANADQQPWPLDPNFPMSVLDPPPNLPLANIEDANNYPPMADPNMAFNIDPTAFPQTNAKVGEDDPSFASFSINGR